MSKFHFWISSKVITRLTRYLWGVSGRATSFFWKMFFLEYSSFADIYAKNWFFHLWENTIFCHLTPKNAIFGEKITFLDQYAGFGSKYPKSILYILQIIKIGHIGWFIKNQKFVIFRIFGIFSTFFWKNFWSQKFQSLQIDLWCFQNVSFVSIVSWGKYFDVYIIRITHMDANKENPKIAKIAFGEK